MHSTGPVRASRAVVLIIVAALSLSACSARTPASGGGGSSGTGVFGGQASAPVAPDEVLGVKKDPTTWSLPFDRVYGGSLLRLQVYASDILVDQCMSNAGFDDFEVLTISSAPFPETQPHGNATLFNVEIAQKYGYRMAPDPGYKPSRENIDLHGGGYYDNKPEAFKNQLYTCQDEVQLELSGPRPTAEVPVDEGGNIPIESQLNRFTVDTSSPQLQEAAAQWRTCMAPQGIADLPQEPWATEIRREMPESLQTRLNFQLTGQPSADEIAVATADAQCRESSGWTSLLYEATWNQQAAFIAAHKAEIDTVVANNDAEAERMRGIIREAGGTP